MNFLLTVEFFFVVIMSLFISFGIHSFGKSRVKLLEYVFIAEKFVGPNDISLEQQRINSAFSRNRFVRVNIIADMCFSSIR